MCEFRVCCFCSESLSAEGTQAAMSFKIRGRGKTHVPACSLLLPCMHYFGSKLQASRRPLRAMAGLLKTLSLGACTLGGFRLSRSSTTERRAHSIASDYPGLPRSRGFQNCAPSERKIRQLSVSAVGPRNTPHARTSNEKRAPSYSHAFTERPL